MIEKSITKKFHEIKVSVNPYIEFLGVIFVLCDFELNKPRNNDEYLNKIKESFHDYKNAKLVLKIKKMLKKPAFKYDAPLEMVLDFIRNEKPSKVLLQRSSITKKEFCLIKEEFFSLFEECKFINFLKNYESEYNQNIHRFIARLLSFSPQDYLFDFLGMKNDNLNVVLMHSVTTANYGLMIKDNLYCMVRPYYKTRYESFDFAYDLPYVTSLLLHEFAHSFINPLTDKFLKDTSRINKEKIAKILQEHPYGDDCKTPINETIIRTIECMYIKNYFSDKFEEFKKEYIEEGFILIDELMNLFYEFKENRKQGETIESIYLKILECFY